MNAKPEGRPQKSICTFMRSCSIFFLSEMFWELIELVLLTVLSRMDFGGHSLSLFHNFVLIAEPAGKGRQRSSIAKEI